MQLNGSDAHISIPERQLIDYVWFVRHGAAPAPPPTDPEGAEYSKHKYLDRSYHEWL